MTTRGISIRVGSPIGALPLTRLRTRWLCAMLAGIAVWGFCDSASALIVGATPGVLPNTSSAPANDPGFANVARTTSFTNAVYLGDGWMLSAAHTGAVGPETVTFPHLPGPIPAILNQNYVVPNPPGLGLTAETDLRLYRIADEPSGTKSLLGKIAAAPPTPNNVPGAEVMMISIGRTRDPLERSYEVNTSANPWTWGDVTGNPSGNPNYYGYGTGNNGIATKSWGTNQIANEDQFFPPEQQDADLLGTVKPGSRHVISYFTTYDKNASTYEAQVIGGDSGSPVFYNRNGQWELSGIAHSNFLYSGQSSAVFNPSNGLAVYGNASVFADLSSYRDQILAIINGHPNYSIMGDVNLDGVLWGNGTGSTSTDDIAAFIAGWKYDNGLPQGNLASWKKGDLNRDGTTDVADFILLRTAFNGQPMGAAVLSLVASAVPEPSAALLAFLGAALLASGWRRRALPPR